MATEGDGKPLIGFIGQGYIGKNYADDFERRGYDTVRYSLEEPHLANKDRIAECDVVFIAVPTPTTPAGFDDSIVRDSIGLVGGGKVAVVKSTILPGRTASYQEAYPDRVIFYSPEFLSEASAAEDAARPFSNILGAAKDDEAHKSAAAVLASILPSAPFSLTCSSTEAEIIKYAHNTNGYIQVVLWNLFYDLAQKSDADWSVIAKALAADPFVSHRYLMPVHKSGRGAGGHCFIKDVAALRELYAKETGDALGAEALAAFERKNIELLKNSGKDLDLLEGVYGPAA